MISAFGVEHGEVSKARFPFKVSLNTAGSINRRAQRTAARAKVAAQAAANSRAGKVKSGFSTAAHGAKAAGHNAWTKPVSMEGMVRGVGQGVGSGARKIGTAAVGHLTATGLGVIGGGAGAGVGAASYNSRRKEKKIRAHERRKITGQ